MLQILVGWYFWTLVNHLTSSCRGKKKQISPFLRILNFSCKRKKNICFKFTDDSLMAGHTQMINSKIFLFLYLVLLKMLTAVKPYKNSAQYLGNTNTAARWVIIAPEHLCKDVKTLKCIFENCYRSPAGLCGALQVHTYSNGCVSSVSVIRQLWLYSQGQYLIFHERILTFLYFG